jgi:hypothetical protein
MLVLATVFEVFGDEEAPLIDPVISVVLVIFAFLALFSILFKFAKFFEYDSDGLKVGVINKGLLATDYLKSKEHSLEFDKDKLISFKFQNFIFKKRLVLYIMSKHGHKKKEVFDVSLVSKRKRRYVKLSLNKIIRQNKKNQFDDE